MVGRKVVRRKERKWEGNKEKRTKATKDREEEKRSRRKEGRNGDMIEVKKEEGYIIRRND